MFNRLIPSLPSGDPGSDILLVTLPRPLGVVLEWDERRKRAVVVDLVEGTAAEQRSRVRRGAFTIVGVVFYIAIFGIWPLVADGKERRVYLVCRGCGGVAYGVTALTGRASGRWWWTWWWAQRQSSVAGCGLGGRGGDP